MLVSGVIVIVLLGVGYVWKKQQFEAAYAAASPYEKGWMLIEDRGCTACHQSENSFRAPILKNLIGQSVQLADGRRVTVDAAYVRRALIAPKEEVSAGYQPVMPSYAEQLSEEEIDAIIAALAPASEG